MGTESASTGISEIKNKKGSRHKLLWLMESPGEAHQQLQTKLCCFHHLLSENSGMFFIASFALEASPEESARLSFSNRKAYPKHVMACQVMVQLQFMPDPNQRQLLLSRGPCPYIWFAPVMSGECEATGRVKAAQCAHSLYFWGCYSTAEEAVKVM